ncbi:MAG: bifunctional precorrin-2 dehydrogenase/sirohydrochlorin ferrochelatase [Tannerella sp.]|jgi:siroheme synthase-like protein|nr:bifunctional precorrin-2 dehydrogenase/sirohydrochlorin ferrochelatase [Tannerella sp.]
MEKEELMFLPVSVNITNKKILIIGGGKVGYHKATILSRFTDNVTVISPEFQEGFDDLPFTLVKKEYEKKDLEGIFLVYICTENEALNVRIKNDAETLGLPASVCDNPELCDFISPAIYKNGNITIAVSSNARNVRQSIAIRDRICDLIRNSRDIIFTE